MKSSKRLLCFCMMICMIFTSMNLMNVSTKANEAEKASKQSVEVQLSMQYGNEFALFPETYTLSGNEAENYGFKDSQDGVTCLDALVALHEKILGSTFTKENATECLGISESGWITLAFGDSDQGGNWSFAVNGLSPNDGIETSYGYTSYTIDNALLSNGDDFVFYGSQDLDSYSDAYAFFKLNGKKITSLHAFTQKEVDLELAGYNYAWYGAATETMRELMTKPIDDVKIEVRDDKWEIIEELYTYTDEDGIFSLNFPKAGTYYLSAYEEDTEYGTPFIRPWVEVTVVDPDPYEGKLASEIVDYVCLGSQYTNTPLWGGNPQKTLKNTSLAQFTGISTGNFGGYITYKFDTPIENDERNPYGVDFLVYGNANVGPSFAEPGQVQVSKDGQTWYSLAGAAHYDDYCEWDYEMTYSKNDAGKTDWADNRGGKGTFAFAKYPQLDNYPLHSFKEGEENSISVNGIRLFMNDSSNYGGTTADYAPQADWGYVDNAKNESDFGVAGNPYKGDFTAPSAFDLDWAVDADGMPVKLDSVSYVKIVTATNIVAGTFGEKSTEVTSIVKTVNALENAAKTEMPETITVDGTSISLVDGKNVYEAKVVDDFSVSVNSVAENVYINDMRAVERDYETIPNKGIVRIVVQNADAAPYICYLKLTEDTEKKQQMESEKRVQDVIDKIAAIGQVTLDSADTVKEAEEAYDALSDEEKKLVQNIDVLSAAKEKIETLKQEASKDDSKVDSKEDPKDDSKVDPKDENKDEKPVALAAPVVSAKQKKNKAQINLSWKAVESAQKYNIYVSTTGKADSYKLLATVSETTYADKTVKQQNNYYVVEATCEKSGVKSVSPKSKEVKVVLAAPKMAKISAKKNGKKSATISWKKVKEASGYEVYMKTGKGSFKRVAKITKNSKVSYKKSNMKKKTTYSFKVRAFKKYGKVYAYGSFSNVKNIKF